MNNEIINKIKSRMAGELLPEQLNKLFCDSKNQSCLVTIHHKKFTENWHYPLFKEIQMW